jgi:hypothetical protein
MASYRHMPLRGWRAAKGGEKKETDHGAGLLFSGRIAQ